MFYLNGKFVKKDINKAIFYLQFAANQQFIQAHFNLGLIYYNLNNLEKSIQYLSFAAENNFSYAQYNLGIIYYNNIKIPAEINKAIYYFSLAADNNNIDAQYILARIYFYDKCVTRDINKAFHYLMLAVEKNHRNALFTLGEIYFIGNYVPHNINKAIYYLTLAAMQKHKDAQFILGIIYASKQFSRTDLKKALYYFQLAANANHIIALLFMGINEYFKNNMNKSTYYFYRCAKLGNIQANFIFGFFKHEGNYVQQNIQEAIKFYKEASSFYDQYSKNNLGIIYKNGFGNEITKNLGSAIIYFEEGIHQRNDKVCMYNLAHIYIYEIPTEDNFNKSIELLIKSSIQNFSASKNLLSLVLYNKYKLDFIKIRNAIDDFSETSNKLSSSIIRRIQQNNLSNDFIFQELFEKYKTIDFLYDQFNKCFPSRQLNSRNQRENSIDTSRINITKDFYDGFGYDLP